jgi:beta-glucoside operon transcriptional antiterminator
MKIHQILNNNVVLAKDNKTEMIVLSKGIAFRKRVGDIIQENEIDKLFILDSNDFFKKFRYLLQNTKEEYIFTVTKIIRFAENRLNVKANNYLYLTLLDHINFMMERIENSQFLKSPLSWEVKKFYRQQYEIGKQALQIIKHDLNVTIPEEEAVSLALHFINLQTNTQSMENTMKMMNAIQDILTIITYHFNVSFNEESINYARLIVHLQFLIQRVLEHNFNQEIDESEINFQLKTKYPDVYSCVQKIRYYIHKKFGEALSLDEETYLMVHIQRVIR